MVSHILEDQVIIGDNTRTLQLSYGSASRADFSVRVRVSRERLGVKASADPPLVAIASKLHIFKLAATRYDQTPSPQQATCSITLAPCTW